MTTYSDWIIIPKDRKCDLPPDTKVQVMGVTQSMQNASQSEVTSVVCYLNTDGKTWRKAYFAHRVVQEPVEEVREYPCKAIFYETDTPSFFFKPNLRATKGTATETTRDGKPYEFHWVADA